MNERGREQVPGLPRFSRWIVSRVVRAEDREFVVGDLDEEFVRRGRSAEARRWYRSQAVRTAATALLSRIRDTGNETMETVMREVCHAVRRLLRAPSFTLPALMTLALAIGLNAAIFTLVLRVVLAPLPYPDPDRLVALDHGAPGLNRPSGLGLTAGLYAHYRERSRVFESVALHRTFGTNVSGDGEAERVMVTTATPSLARVLRTEPQVGRWFSEEEGEPGGPRAVVLSHGLWQRRFGGDVGVIGRGMLVDGEPADIVGVMPAGFRASTLLLIGTCGFEPATP